MGRVWRTLWPDINRIDAAVVLLGQLDARCTPIEARPLVERLEAAAVEANRQATAAP